MEVLRVILFLLPWTVVYSDCVEEGNTIEFKFNSWDVVGPLDHFWRSTGFCPPDPHQRAAGYMLSADMEQNLAYIGALPHTAIEQVRIHWLFDLVKVHSITNGHPNYDFGNLDKMIALLHVNGLKPGFEIMGNPSSFFTDMENRTQVHMWRDLVALTASRYIGKYGHSYVEKWNFETWNEPDCGDFDKLHMSIQGFLNYYDACSEGLKSVSQSLKIGGPGDGCDSLKFKSYKSAFFDHVASGRNYFTGQKGVRLDFISMHRKGGGVAKTILDDELLFHFYLAITHPSIAHKPFFNDEADPLVGWSKSETWRAGSAYAAIAAKVIGQHQNIIKGNRTLPFNYQLLSNDNGFLSFYPHQFTQRTLLARFQMNNTKEPYVTFVPKPIYAMMASLDLIGDQLVHLDASISGRPLSNTSHFGAIASLHEPQNASTSDCWQSTFFIYNSCDIGHGSDWGDLDLRWNIRPPPGNMDLRLKMYMTSPISGDPYGVWTGLYNLTDYPTLKQFKYMWKQGNPSASNITIQPNATTVILPPRFQILTDTVVVLHLCAKSQHPPEQVSGLRFIPITNGQVLLVWSDENIRTKCIGTYEVDYSPSETGPFRRVNPDVTIVTAAVIAPEPASGVPSDELVRGFYRVRAVDYFDRAGPYSDVIKY